uniref:HupE/UreJ family protein n=1 Tax=Pararhizobium sp. IMCC3301 TaxID=3067904 RepID=UPI002740D20E|nr:HupE/UreJ family protein [Pararhizobium sp. IMCC3301]
MARIFSQRPLTGFTAGSLPLVFLITIASLIGWSFTARAHEIQPAIADLVFSPDQSGYQLEIALNLEAALAGVGSEHADTDQSPKAEEYDALRALSAAQLRDRLYQVQQNFLSQIFISADDVALEKTIENVSIPDVGDLSVARASRIVLRGNLPPDAQNMTFSWAPSFGAVVLRGPLSEAGEGYSAYLQNGTVSDPVSIQGQTTQSVWQVISDYVTVGFTHIIPKGLDHILFVVGLFLLSTKLSPLLWQVTAFTLAHTITLALGMLGLVSVPAAIVEPLIAASIVYICVENLFLDHLTKWRPIVIFGFGLLHGLGFASVLTEIGLSRSYFITGLISFNVGVELGQISVIFLCFMAVGFWFRNKPWYRPFIIIPGSLIIAAIGAFWFLERTILA